MTDFLPIASSSRLPTARSDQSVRAAAEKLEATFLSEMLKAAGLDAQPHSFSGGIGEEQFASFKRDALANAMVERGGIGLAEVFYNALKEKHDERS